MNTTLYSSDLERSVSKNSQRIQKHQLKTNLIKCSTSQDSDESSPEPIITKITGTLKENMQEIDKMIWSNASEQLAESTHTQDTTVLLPSTEDKNTTLHNLPKQTLQTLQRKAIIEGTNRKVNVNPQIIAATTNKIQQTDASKDDGSTASSDLSDATNYDDDTPVQIIFPQLPFRTRFDVKVSTAATDNALRTLKEELVALITRLKECDPTIVHYPWAESTSEKLPALHTAEQYPTTNTKLKAYFETLYAKQNGGITFSAIYIGHTVTAEELIEEVDMEFRPQQRGLYLRRLQCPHTTDIGWLSYSTRDINIVVLREYLEKKLKIPIDVRWRAIIINTPGQKELPRDRVRAIHLAVEEKHAEYAKEELFTIYSVEAPPELMPLQIKMGLVNVQSKKKQSTTSTETLIYLKARHDTFQKNSRTVYSNDIQALYRSWSKLGQFSLHNCLMAIKSTVHPNRYVFHSVDMDSQQHGQTVFTCHKDLLPEAQAICSGLVLYMQNYVGRQYITTINKCFHKKAVSDAGGEWNEDTKQVVTKEDLHSLDLLKSDQGPGYNETSVRIENIMAAAATAQSVVSNKDDDDTISAMTAELQVRSRVQKELQLLANQSRPAPSLATISTQETVSTITATTTSENASKIANLATEASFAPHTNTSIVTQTSNQHLTGSAKTGDIK
jgi:hypothetical protein